LVLSHIFRLVSVASKFARISDSHPRFPADPQRPRERVHFSRWTGHFCPLDRAFLPGGPDISARSTEHLCPLDRAFLPAGPDIPARSGDY
jgi:hypothetical protein